MKILVVEDDPKISSFIQKGLKQSQYLVEEVANGRTALDHILIDKTIDLIVLDIMLPEMSGLEVLAEMRKAGINTPVLVLSAKRTVEEKVEGLQYGADDYMEKPFSFSELLARVQALLRRRMPESKVMTSLTCFDLSMNLLKREVHRQDKLIDLQAKEFSLLEYFMRNPGRVLTKTMILENIYGYNFDTQTNVVDVLVFRLRSKIDKDFEKKLLHTIRGVGYVLKEG